MLKEPLRAPVEVEAAEQLQRRRAEGAGVEPLGQRFRLPLDQQLEQRLAEDHRQRVLALGDEPVDLRLDRVRPRGVRQPAAVQTIGSSK